MSAWIRWLTSGQARAGIDPLDLVLQLALERAHPGLEREPGPGPQRRELVLQADRPRGIGRGQGRQAAADLAQVGRQPRGGGRVVERRGLGRRRLAQLVEGGQDLGDGASQSDAARARPTTSSTSASAKRG